MNDVKEGKIVGGSILLFGIFALISGKAGLTIYGRLDGNMAKVAGILMIILGTKLMFPMLGARKKKSETTDEKK